VTQGFGRKWKEFFQELEFGHGLSPDLDAHIWLLHHLFLADINQDAEEWAVVWNSHRMHIRGERERSPRDMFIFGMIQNGPCGLEQDEVEDINGYGVDWADLDDPAILGHHEQHNPDDAAIHNPFVSRDPDEYSHVEVANAPSPLSSEQIELLDQELSQVPLYRSRSMSARRDMWIHALAFCRHMLS